MERYPRVRLLAVVGLLCAADTGLTLIGQPVAYWAADYSAAVEANPLAFPFLARGPWVFVGLAVGWWGLLVGLVLSVRHPLADWAAALVGVGHAVGGGSWLARSGPWGWLAAVGFLLVAAAILRTSWPGDLRTTK